jgi:hemoglobin
MTESISPYERIGAEPAVRRIVARFYEVMDSDPAAAPLRAMHAGDLAPMREKLGDFLVGWLGGPPRYFERADARCMGQAHSPFAINGAIRDQWLMCMHRALDDEGVDAELQSLIRNALARMTGGMVNA